MKKYVIVINGPATSGKDTFVDLFRKLLYGFSNVDVTSCSYVEPVKDLLHPVIADLKGEKERKFLADTLMKWEDYNNGPMEILEGKIDNFHVRSYYKKYNMTFVFVCCREPKRIQYLKEKYNACTLLITRPDAEPIQSNEADAHVFDFSYDYDIYNDGTIEQLQDKAYEFYKFLRDSWEVKEDV